jgi:hypothetical protein
MTERNSFKDVIENDYYNDIFETLSGFIELNADRLDLSTYKVENPEHAEMSDFEIKVIRIHDKGSFAIEFDIVLSAEITVSEYRRSKSDLETDTREQWFCLKCSGELEDGLQNFQILNTSLYSQSRLDKDGRMTDSLVPIISKNQLDNEATAFLQQYYPEALLNPMPLPVYNVAKNMGLTIKEVSLTRHLTLFGMMVFGDCSVKYYDNEGKTYKSMDVSKGSILVDPNVYFMRNLGCFNNTVIHECVHWHKHRKYHELTKMFRLNDVLIACRVDEKEQSQNGKRTDQEWMEWHANALAPRILMPKEMTLKKIEEYRQEYDNAFPSAPALATMDYVIVSLADFFNVSKLAAKIRMLDLDYPEAAGLYEYINDHYVSPYAFPVESKISNQTYSISISDAFFEYFVNLSFREIISSGNFIYVDGHYVINAPQYIERTSFGGIGLTDYAREHVGECCLRFDLKLDENSKNDIVVYLDSVRFRSATSAYNKVPAYKDDDCNKKVQERARELCQAINDETETVNATGRNFAQIAAYHITKMEIDESEFCEKTLLSPKTYRRIMKNNLQKPTFETAMAICIGLELGMTHGPRLLEAAGINIFAAQYIQYKKLLESCCGLSILECNEIFSVLGYPLINAKAYRETTE